MLNISSAFAEAVWLLHLKILDAALIRVVSRLKITKSVELRQ